ncbi:MAG: hypothetical protein IPK78_07435 [Rhodospirillales bacterium]|nr:hypothetical protein [Rhodospirillales bacterium]
MIRLVVPLLSALGVAATVLPASAQATGQATLNAVAFQPVPHSQAIEVRVLDNSNENLAIMGELQAALRQRGVPVGAGDVPLLLTIDTSDSVGAWTAPGATDRIRMMDDRGRLFPQGELDMARQARLPLAGTTVVTPAQYRLGLTLDSRISGCAIVARLVNRLSEPGPALGVGGGDGAKAGR